MSELAAAETLAQDVPATGSPGQRLARNSIFGLVSFSVPTAVLLAAYPLLIHRIGTDAFGVFILASGLTGSIGLLDPGLTPATTHFVAKDMALGHREEAARSITTSLLLYTMLGLAGSMAVWLAAPWLASTFSGNNVDRTAAEWAFRLAGLQIGTTFLINVCAGTFKGLHRFDWSALLMSTLAITSYGAALVATLVWSPDLLSVAVAFTLAYVGVAAFGLVLLAAICLRLDIPIILARPSLSTLRRLVRFGIVMTGNSLASFFLYQIQRFVVGAAIGPAAVTVYQLATTIPGKAQTLIASATEALFPFASSNPGRVELRRAYLRMLKGGALIAFVLLGVLTIWRGPILNWWIGSQTAADAAAVLPLFAAAYFLISLTPAPYYLANGMGKPYLNTACYLLDGLSNVMFLAILLPGGLTLAKVGWAFLAANLINAVVYQILAERVLWRKWRHVE